MHAEGSDGPTCSCLLPPPARSCLLSKIYNAAAEVVEADMFEVDPTRTGVTVTDFFLYCYLGGMISIGAVGEGARGRGDGRGGEGESCNALTGAGEVEVCAELEPRTSVTPPFSSTRAQCAPCHTQARHTRGQTPPPARGNTPAWAPAHRLPRRPQALRARPGALSPGADRAHAGWQRGGGGLPQEVRAGGADPPG